MIIQRKRINLKNEKEKRRLDVILKDGRVLRYNDANSASLVNSVFIIYNDIEPNYFIAKIPIDNVERIDSIKPCKILYESRSKKNRQKY